MEISFNDYVEKLEGIYGNNLGIEDCLAHIILSEYGKEIVEIEKIEISEINQIIQKECIKDFSFKISEINELKEILISEAGESNNKIAEYKITESAVNSEGIRIYEISGEGSLKIEAQAGEKIILKFQKESFIKKIESIEFLNKVEEVVIEVDGNLYLGGEIHNAKNIKFAGTKSSIGINDLNVEGKVEIVGLSAYFYNNIRCSEFNLKEGEITKTFEKSNILTKGSVNIESQKIYKKGKVYSEGHISLKGKDVLLGKESVISSSLWSKIEGSERLDILGFIFGKESIELYGKEIGLKGLLYSLKKLKLVGSIDIKSQGVDLTSYTGKIDMDKEIKEKLSQVNNLSMVALEGIDCEGNFKINGSEIIIGGLGSIIGHGSSEIFIINSKIQSLYDLSFIGKILKLGNNSEINSEGSIDLKIKNIDISKSGLHGKAGIHINKSADAKEGYILIGEESELESQEGIVKVCSYGKIEVKGAKLRGKSQVNIEGLSVEFKNIYIEGKNVGANVEGKEIYVSSDGVLNVSGAKFSFEQKGNFVCQDKMYFTDEAIIIGAGNSLFKAENGIDFGSVGFNLSGISKLIVGSNSGIGLSANSVLKFGEVHIENTNGGRIGKLSIKGGYFLVTENNNVIRANEIHLEAVRAEFRMRFIGGYNDIPTIFSSYNGHKFYETRAITNEWKKYVDNRRGGSYSLANLYGNEAYVNDAIHPGGGIFPGGGYRSDVVLYLDNCKRYTYVSSSGMGFVIHTDVPSSKYNTEKIVGNCIAVKDTGNKYHHFQGFSECEYETYASDYSGPAYLQFKRGVRIDANSIINHYSNIVVKEGLEFQGSTSLSFYSYTGMKYKWYKESSSKAKCISQATGIKYKAILYAGSISGSMSEVNVRNSVGSDNFSNYGNIVSVEDRKGVAIFDGRPRNLVKNAIQGLNYPGYAEDGYMMKIYTYLNEYGEQLVTINKEKIEFREGFRDIPDTTGFLDYIASGNSARGEIVSNLEIFTSHVQLEKQLSATGNEVVNENNAIIKAKEYYLSNLAASYEVSGYKLIQYNERSGVFINPHLGYKSETYLSHENFMKLYGVDCGVKKCRFTYDENALNEVIAKSLKHQYDGFFKDIDPIDMLSNLQKNSLDLYIMVFKKVEGFKSDKGEIKAPSNEMLRNAKSSFIWPKYHEVCPSEKVVEMSILTSYTDNGKSLNLFNIPAMYMLANGEEEGGIVKYINNQIAIKNDDFSKIKLAYTSAVRVDGCYGFEIYLSKEDIEKGLITGNIAAREEFDVDIRGNVLVENLQKLQAGKLLKLNIAGEALVFGDLEAENIVVNSGGKFVLKGHIKTTKDLLVNCLSALIEGYIKANGSIYFKTLEDFVQRMVVKIHKSGARGYYYEKHEIESKSKIEADETINFDAGGDYANVASEVIGGNVIIQAAGEVVVLSQKLYEEIHIWSKNHVNRMTITDYETAKITSTGSDNSAGRPSIVVYAGKGIYMEAPTIKALEGGLSITAEEKIEIYDVNKEVYKYESHTKRRGGLAGATGGTKTTIKQEMLSTPIQSLIDVKEVIEINARNGVVIKGFQFFSEATRINVNNPDYEGFVSLFNSYKIHTITITTIKTGFDIVFKNGVKIVKRSEKTDISSSEEVIPSLMMVKDKFYGYCQGGWIELSVERKGGHVFIDAKNVHLMAAPNRYYEFAIYKENGIGIAFSNDDGELALKAGAYWHKSEESLERVKYEHVDWEVQGVRLNAEDVLSYAGMKIKTNLWMETAREILKPELNDASTKDVSIEDIFFGVKLGVKSNVQEAYKNTKQAASSGEGIGKGLDKFGDQDSSLGRFMQATAVFRNVMKLASSLNGAFAAFKALKQFDLGISFGVWLHAEYKAHKHHEEAKSPVVNYIKVAGDYVTKSEYLEIYGDQIEAMNMYIETKKLKAHAATGKRSYRSEDFKFDLDIPLDSYSGGGVGMDYSEMKVDEVRPWNINIRVAGDLKINVQGDASIKGASIRASSVEAAFENLVMASLLHESKERGWSLSLDLSKAGKDSKKGEKTEIGRSGKSDLVGVGGGISRGDRSVVEELTEIIGSDKVEIVMAKTLELTGAMIANAEIDENGNYTDKGNLAISVGMLIAKNIEEYDKGFKVSSSITASKYSEKKEKGEEQEKWKKITDIEGGYKDKVGTVPATIGKGEIRINTGTEGKLNRDIRAAIVRDLKGEDFEFGWYHDTSKTIKETFEELGNNIKELFVGKQEQPAVIIKTGYDGKEDAKETSDEERKESSAYAERVTIHEISKGETLSEIARSYGISVEELMKLNPQIKDPNVIYINQKLAVPYQSKVQNKNTAELFSAVEEGGMCVSPQTYLQTSNPSENELSEREKIKELVDNILGVSFSEEAYDEIFLKRKGDPELDKVLLGFDRDIAVLAAYWRYLKSDHLDKAELKKFTSNGCKDCTTDLSKIIKKHKEGSNLQVFNTGSIDKVVKVINDLAQEISPYTEKFFNGHNKAAKKGENSWVGKIFDPMIDKVEKSKFAHLTDDQSQAFEFFSTLSIVGLLQKSGHNIKTVGDLEKIQMVAASDITISEATIKYFYTRESQLINYKKIVEIEKGLFSNYKSSFTKGTNAIEMPLKEGDLFVRVIGPDSPKAGNWVMLKEDVVGLSTKEIQKKFALKHEPTHYVDVKISNPTKDHKVLIGDVAPQPEFQGKPKGGGTQFFLEFEIDPRNEKAVYNSWFGNKKEIPNGGIK